MGRDSKGSDLGKEQKLRSRSRPGAAEGTKPSLGQEVLSQDLMMPLQPAIKADSVLTLQCSGSRAQASGHVPTPVTRKLEAGGFALGLL